MADDRLLARLLRTGSTRLVTGTVSRLLPDPASAERPSLPRRLAQTALLRIATRSVPGAIVIGGGLLARHLHLARKAKAARDAADAPPGATKPPATTPGEP